jgi:hypothetical protein
VTNFELAHLRDVASGRDWMKARAILRLLAAKGLIEASIRGRPRLRSPKAPPSPDIEVTPYGRAVLAGLVPLAPARTR